MCSDRTSRATRLALVALLGSCGDDGPSLDADTSDVASVAVDAPAGGDAIIDTCPVADSNHVNICGTVSDFESGMLLPESGILVRAYWQAQWPDTPLAEAVLSDGGFSFVGLTIPPDGVLVISVAPASTPKDDYIETVSALVIASGTSVEIVVPAIRRKLLGAWIERSELPAGLEALRVFSIKDETGMPVAGLTAMVDGTSDGVRYFDDASTTSHALLSPSASATGPNGTVVVDPARVGFFEASMGACSASRPTASWTGKPPAVVYVELTLACP